MKNLYTDLLKRTLFGVGLLIIIYISLGVAFLYFGTAIYDDIPRNEFNISAEKTFTMYIRNNAKVTFPFVEPHFDGQVKIIDSTRNTTCTIQSSEGLYLVVKAW